ncbi:MAG: FAD binding domain-containing protein, partial [Bradyrhizobium sp.]
GENRLHAVLGWSEGCIATHPSDFCVPLVALDAVVEIEGKDGRRELPLDALHRLPGETPERETALERGWRLEGPARATVRIDSARRPTDVAISTGVEKGPQPVWARLRP